MKKLLILLTLLTSCATIPSNEENKGLRICRTDVVKHIFYCVDISCSVVTEEGYPATVEAETISKGDKIYRVCFEERYRREE